MDSTAFFGWLHDKSTVAVYRVRDGINFGDSFWRPNVQTNSVKLKYGYKDKISVLQALCVRYCYWIIFREPHRLLQDPKETLDPSLCTDPHCPPTGTAARYGPSAPQALCAGPGPRNLRGHLRTDPGSSCPSHAVRAVGSWYIFGKVCMGEKIF